MKKIFLVTDGEYSNYHIVGAYSSEQDADLVVERFGGQVEEFQLDPNMAKIRSGYTIFKVDITRDGQVLEVVRGGYSDLEFYSPPFVCQMNDGTSRTEFALWAKHEAQAVKTANEMRAQLIANNEWPTAEEAGQRQAQILVENQQYIDKEHFEFAAEFIASDPDRERRIAKFEESLNKE